MVSFNNIIGHEEIIRHLQNAMKTGKVSHSYIFTGRPGSGKKLLATTYAMTLQCEAGGTEPCQKCDSCKKALGKNHPDIIMVNHEKPGTISIDEIREQVIHDVAIKPYSSPHKIYIIPDAEMMTVQAQNALLKTIEEPPEYAVIMLLTSNVDALLPTIQSRCVTINTKPISKEEIAGYLVSHLSMEREQAEIAAGFCQGNMGKAIRFANSKDFQEMKEDTLHLLKNIEHMDISEIVDSIRIFSQKKGMIDDYLDLMLLWYRDVLMFKVTKDANLLLYRDRFHDISHQASVHTYESIENILQAIDKAKVRLGANVNFEVTMELMALTMKD